MIHIYIYLYVLVDQSIAYDRNILARSLYPHTRPSTPNRIVAMSASSSARATAAPWDPAPAPQCEYRWPTGHRCQSWSVTMCQHCDKRVRPRCMNSARSYRLCTIVTYTIRSHDHTNGRLSRHMYIIYQANVVVDPRPEVCHRHSTLRRYADHMYMICDRCWDEDRPRHTSPTVYAPTIHHRVYTFSRHPRYMWPHTFVGRPCNPQEVEDSDKPKD